MKSTLALLTLILMHSTLGRKASIPYGMACGMNIYLVLSLALILDTLFTSLIYSLSKQAALKIRLLRKIKERIIYTQEGLSHSTILMRLKPLGKMGVVVATAIPFTGGINVSIPLVHILNLDEKEVLFLLSMGNFLGCLLIALGVKGILLCFHN